jgi:hypothetical protein
MITVSQLIYGQPMADTGQPCALCAQPLASEPLKVSDAFTNFDRLRFPGSDLVCPACAWCLRTPQLRRGSWIASMEGLRYLQRPAISGALFNPPEPPFAIYVTTSFKKHGFFKARVNLSRACFYVQFEEVGVEFEPPRWTAVGEALWNLYAAGFSKRELLHGDYNQRKVRLFGREAWWAFEELLRPRRPESAFGLLVHSLYREEAEGKDGGKANTNSAPR